MNLFALIKKHINLNWIVVTTVISVTWVNFNQERWKGKNIIAHDVANYYSYLPALFYEKDLSLSFLNDTINQQLESRIYLPNHTQENNPVIKMSMGMAITYLPFFTLAHVYSNFFNYPTDGFSSPYHFAIQFSTLFYYTIGLFFLWRVLRLYFSISTSSLTLICLTFGTNVFYYLTIGAGMSHLVNFALIAAFLFFTIQWHKKLNFNTALSLGIIGGLLTLIRPTNVLIFLFFYLYNVKSLKEVSTKFKLLFIHKFHLVAIGLSVFLIFLPQLFYWKYTTGQYFFNSYVDEHFYFNNPHILKALFGFRKGWLVYTPIMIFSLIGFYFLRNHLKSFVVALTVFFALYIYVTFSWWCWWYGGTFGQRVLIDIYPLLAIPLGAMLTSVLQQNSLKRKIIYSLVGFFIFLNLFQTIQAKYNIIHYDAMTRENYSRVFFTITKKADREKYLVHPDYEKAKKGEE